MRSCFASSRDHQRVKQGHRDGQWVRCSSNIARTAEKRTSWAVVLKKKHSGQRVFQETKFSKLYEYMEDVGTTKVLVGKFKGEKIWIACQVDSKHTTLIGNTWSTTERNGKKMKRKVGGRLVEFNYCEYQNTWYWIRMQSTMQTTIECTLFLLKIRSTPNIGLCGNLHSSMQCMSATLNRPTTIGSARSKTNI
jgi:hypothetical protein